MEKRLVKISGIELSVYVVLRVKCEFSWVQGRLCENSQGPDHGECTRSRPITEVKRRRHKLANCWQNNLIKKLYFKI